MNTAITKIDANPFRTAVRQLRNMSWKRRSLLAAGLAMTGYTLKRVDPLTLLAGGVLAFGLCRVASGDAAIKQKVTKLRSLAMKTIG